MINVREALKQVSPVPSRGRLNSEVREIAARTQVPIQDFRECPNCEESMFNQFELSQVETSYIEFSCHRCDKTGEIEASGETRYNRS
jgi:phage FluMu protein Com